MKIITFLSLLVLIAANDVFSQQNSELGSSIPVKGTVKVLLVWAEVTNTFTNPSSVGGYGEGALPADANDFFDNSFTPGVEPTAYISKYFYQQSFGKYPRCRQRPAGGIIHCSQVFFYVF